MMEILVAKNAGFCFGVKRAIEIAFKIAEKDNNKVYTFGPIIHNPQVIEKLRSMGVMPIENVEDLTGLKGVLIIRTHGVPLEVMNKLKETDLEIIDATCPFVTKAQHYAKLLRDEGYKVVILGDREHPEVKGLMSYAGADVITVNSVEVLPKLTSKIGVVVQTTQQVDSLKKLLNGIIEHVKELKVYNTICNSTAQRQRETADIAKSVDAMIIVGGRNSANTTKLATLCMTIGVSTYHIETSDELLPEWFRGVRKVGITAGASTPDWIIEEVKKRISDIGGMGADGL